MIFERLSQQVRQKSFGIKSLTIIAFTSLLTGMTLSSGMNLTGLSQAEAPPAAAQITDATTFAGGSFSTIAERLSPAVVNIKVVSLQKAQFHMPSIPDGPFGDMFERYFKDRNRFPQDRMVQGAGSGVIISPDGYILTNNHVVEGAKELTVTLSDKRESRAEIVGRDPGTDLAVIKLKDLKDAPAAKMGDSDALKVGDWVLAIGNPFGLSHTVTSGIVSAKGRVLGAGAYDDFIQTDASINPGNSGGPLFNMNGEIVGINTAIIPNGQGIGFAIPVNTAKPLIPQLIDKGEVTRGYIGVNIQSVTADIADALKLDKAKGALVADVVPGGPADNAGIQRGDIIVAFNGKEVKDSHDLPAMVASGSIGENATVTVLRDGDEKKLKVKVDKLRSSGERSEEATKESQGKWGMELQDLNKEMARRLDLESDGGIVITNIRPGSPADEAAMKRGDIILEVNRKPVGSVKELKEQIAAAEAEDSLLILVQRDRARLYVALKSKG